MCKQQWIHAAESLSTAITYNHTIFNHDAAFPAQGDSPPRALVLLLGWCSAKIQHIEKYAELYQKRGCATVITLTDPHAVLLKHNPSLNNLAVDVACRAVEILQSWENREGSSNRPSINKKIPVIIHAFSNGGAYIAERLEYMIQQVRSGVEYNKPPTIVIDKVKDYLRALSRNQKMPVIIQSFGNVGAFFAETLEYSVKEALRIDVNRAPPGVIEKIGEHLQGEVFDSAPVYPDNETALVVINRNIKSELLRAIAIYFFLLLELMEKLMVRVLGLQQRSLVYWESMTNSTVCLRQAYVYSSKDSLTKLTELEELIEHRRKLSQGGTTALRFDDSEHVQHLLSHRMEYEEMLNDFLNSVVNDREIELYQNSKCTVTETCTEQESTEFCGKNSAIAS